MKVITNKFTIRALSALTLIVLSFMSKQVLAADKLDANPIYEYCTIPENYGVGEFLFSKQTCKERRCAAPYVKSIGDVPDASAPANWSAYGYKDVASCASSQYLPNFYEILGLPNTDSSNEDIKKAYRKTVMKIHPDRTRTFPDIQRYIAEEMFKRVSNANTLLQDPLSRIYYDNSLRYNRINKGNVELPKDFLDNIKIAAAASGGATESKGGGGGGGGGGGAPAAKPAGDVNDVQRNLQGLYATIGDSKFVVIYYEIKDMITDPRKMLPIPVRRNQANAIEALRDLERQTKTLLDEYRANFQWTADVLDKFNSIEANVQTLLIDLPALYDIVDKFAGGTIDDTEHHIAQAIRAAEATIAQYSANPTSVTQAALDGTIHRLELIEQLYENVMVEDVATAEQLGNKIDRSVIIYLSTLNPSWAIRTGYTAAIARKLVDLTEIKKAEFTASRTIFAPLDALKAQVRELAAREATRGAERARAERSAEDARRTAEREAREREARAAEEARARADRETRARAGVALDLKAAKRLFKEWDNSGKTNTDLLRQLRDGFGSGDAASEEMIMLYLSKLAIPVAQRSTITNQNKHVIIRRLTELIG